MGGTSFCGVAFLTGRKAPTPGSLEMLFFFFGSWGMWQNIWRIEGTREGGERSEKRNYHAKKKTFKQHFFGKRIIVKGLHFLSLVDWEASVLRKQLQELCEYLKVCMHVHHGVFWKMESLESFFFLHKIVQVFFFSLPWLSRHETGSSIWEEDEGGGNIFLRNLETDCLEFVAVPFFSLSPPPPPPPIPITHTEFQTSFLMELIGGGGGEESCEVDAIFHLFCRKK